MLARPLYGCHGKLVTYMKLALENINLLTAYKILAKPNQGLFYNMKNISKLYRSSHKCKWSDPSQEFPCNKSDIATYFKKHSNFRTVDPFWKDSLTGITQLSYHVCTTSAYIWSKISLVQNIKVRSVLFTLESSFR